MLLLTVRVAGRTREEIEKGLDQVLRQLENGQEVGYGRDFSYEVSGEPGDGLACLDECTCSRA